MFAFFFSKDHVKFLTQQLDECSVFSMIDFKGGNTWFVCVAYTMMKQKAILLLYSHVL